MTDLALLQIAGLIAACCFFAAGYLSGRSKKFARREISSRLANDHDEPRSFDVIVRRVAEHDGVKSVAIADEQSLTIAGVGEHQEGLAVLGGALLDSAAKVQALLPLGRVSRIILETDAGTSVGSFPVKLGKVVGVLATWTDGPPPASKDLLRDLNRS